MVLPTPKGPQLGVVLLKPAHHPQLLPSARIEGGDSVMYRNAVCVYGPVSGRAFNDRPCGRNVNEARETLE